MIIYSQHSLSTEQLSMLNRGPSYVLPCHMRLNSTNIDTVLNEQMAPLRKQLTQIFAYHKIHLARRFQLEKLGKDLFYECFKQTVPESIMQRSQYEHDVLASIRISLEEHDLCLRRSSDQTNLFYLMNNQQYQSVIDDYLKKASWYDSLGDIELVENSQTILQVTIQQVNELLEGFHRQKLINTEQYEKTKVKRQTPDAIPFLYFLPNQSEIDGKLMVIPQLSTIRHLPVRRLAIFLENLIRPMYERHARATSLINGTDLIVKLEQYSQQPDCLLPSTRFVTIQIQDIYYCFSHERLLNSVNQFLAHALLIHRHQNLSIDTIQQLIALVLRHMNFTYGKKFYRFVRGAPRYLPLISTLINIYLQEWQSPLLRQARISDQLFVRYHDQILFTWDSTRTKIESILDELHQTYPDIEVKLSIDLHANLLNLYMENKRGSLYTRVYQNDAHQLFTLPYVSAHPRLGHRQWFQFALVRAGQYCQSVVDFDQQRRYIESTFLVNGYSLAFVEQQLQHFYERYNVLRLRTDLNPVTYNILRRSVCREFVPLYTGTSELTVSTNTDTPIYHIYYLFDWGYRCRFNEKFQQFWSTMIATDVHVKNVPFKIQLSTEHCDSLHKLLGQPYRF